MSKLATFFYVLRRTFTDLSYYHEISKASFWFSYKYLTVYVFFYAVVATIYFGVTLVPKVNYFLDGLPEKIVDVFPQELTINVINGEVYTNVQEPYFITLDSLEEKFVDEKVLSVSTEKLINMLAIDTNAKVEDFDNYQTLVLLTKNAVVARDREGTRFTKLDSKMNLVINRELIETGVRKFEPYIKYVAPIMMIGIFVGYNLMISWILISLIFFGLIFWLISKLMRNSLGFSVSYRWGMHIVTITYTVFGILMMWGLYLDNPILHVLIMLVVGVFALKHSPKISEHAPAQIIEESGMVSSNSPTTAEVEEIKK